MKTNLFNFRHRPNEFQTQGILSQVSRECRESVGRLSTLLFLIFLGLGFSTQAWAITIDQGNVYFDASTWASPDHVQMDGQQYKGYGNTSYNAVWDDLQQISNTKLYYRYISGKNWGFDNFYFFNATSHWNDNYWNYPPSATNYTGLSTFNINDKDGWYFFSVGSDNSLDGTYIGNKKSHSDVPKRKQTVEVKVDNATPASSPVKIELASYYLTGTATSAGSSVYIDKGATTLSNKYNCVAAAKVTMSYSELATGYSFDGWYDGDTRVSQATSYEYYASDSKTITAKFTENKFNITATANPVAGGTVTPTSATPFGVLTGGSITASNKAGYHFTGWEVGTATGTFGSSSTANTTFTPTKAGTVTANFAVNTHTLTWNAGEGGTLTGGTPAGSVAYGTALTAPTATKTYYDFTSWDPEVPATMPDNDFSSTAQYTEHKYDVKIQHYYANCSGSKISGSQDYPITTDDSTKCIGIVTGKTFNSSSFAKKGFAHHKWYARNGIITCNGQKTEAGESSTTIKGADNDSPTLALTSGVTTSSYIQLYDIWIERTRSVAVYQKLGNNDSTLLSTLSNIGIYTTGETTAPDATGYHFVSWRIKNNSNYTINLSPTSSATTTISVSSDETAAASGSITAVYAPNVYTITYKDKDNADYSGSNLSSLPTAHTYGTATALVDGIRAGYTFKGWFEDSACTGTAITSIGATAKTAEITLYAKWEQSLVYHSITFGAGTDYTAMGSVTGENTTTSTSISSGDDVLQGSNITLTAHSNTGYDVVGWYSNIECTGTSLQDGGDTYTINNITEAKTVYVKFQEKTFAVTVSAGTGISSVSGSGTLGQVTGGAINAEVKPGYTWSTWSVTSGAGSFEGGSAATQSNKFYPTEASTVTASATENMSAITVSTNGIGSHTVEPANASVGVTTTADLTAQAAKTGYTFTGWTLTDGAILCDGSDLNNLSITIKGDGNGTAGTATANYSLNSHTLSWVTNGDALTGDYTSGTVNYGASITAPNTPTKTGHTFAGWSDGSAIVTPATTMPDNDLTYTATWNANQYNLTLQGNNGHVADTDPEQTFADVTVTYGQGCPTIPTFVRTGYDYSGFGVSIAPNTTKIILQSNTFTTSAGETQSKWVTGGKWTKLGDGTLYAVWTVQSWTRELNKNYTDAGASNGSYKATYDATSIEIKSAPTPRNGYILAGYASAKTDGYMVADTLGNLKTNVPGFTDAQGKWINVTGETDANNPKLYAQWDPITYTITYNTNGGEAVAQGEYNIETATFSLPTTTKAGFAFVGWYDNEKLTGDPVSQITKGSTGNKEFWAKWDTTHVYLEGRTKVKKENGEVVILNETADPWDETLKTIEFNFNTTDNVYYLNTRFTTYELARYFGDKISLIKIGLATGDGEVVPYGCNTSNYYRFTPTASGTEVSSTGTQKFEFRNVETYEGGAFTRRGPVMYKYDPSNSKFTYCAPLLTLTYNGDSANVATMSQMKIAISACAYIVKGLTSENVVYQYKLGDSDWATWTEDIVTVAGTYKLRAVASGNNEFGQAVENVISNEITVTVTTPAVSAQVTHVNGEAGSIIRINDSFTIQHTVTGVPAGQSVQVCYHWKTTPAGSQITKDVFTKVDDPKQPNSVYTTIDVAGDYEIEVSVSSATCETSGVITWQTYTLPIHVKGDEITVYAKLDKSITDWNDKYVHYWKSGVAETTGWPGHKMAYIGKDSTDYEWYSYNITNYKTYAGGNLLFNDGTKTYGKQQTTNLDMPADDAFYMIKTVLKDSKRTASVEDAIDVTKRVVLMNTDLDKLYQYVTITLEPKGVFVPVKDAEMKYTYVMTSKPDGSTVVLNNKNYFTPDKAGTYKVTITCTATGVTSDVFSNTFDLVVAANPLTLTPSATGSNIQIGATTSVTVSAEAKDITDLYKTFTVIEPGTKDPITFKSGAKDPASTAYTLRSSGTYTFGVVLTDGDGVIAGKAQCTVNVNAKALYIKHPFVNKEEKDIVSGDWKWNDLTYNEIDGTYQYSGVDAYYHPSKVANVHTSKASSGLKEYTIQNPDNLSDNTKCLFVYDVTTDKVTVYDLNKRLYRIKSMCANGEEFFSNAVTYNDAEPSLTQQISFFAEKGGGKKWQTRATAADNWVDADTITTTVSASGIYKATPTKLQAEFTLTAYTDNLKVFTQLTEAKTNDGTPTAQNGAMTKFINETEGEYYNYYWVKYCAKNSGDVRQAMATIGNDINNCLATTLPYYELPAGANVRFAYSDKTNSFTRTYLAASSGGNNFLRIYGKNITSTAATPVTLDKAHALQFEDGSNWVYTTTVKGTVAADKSATAILMTEYNSTTRWILAESGLEADPAAERTLMDQNGTSAGTYLLNVIYDYKTNRITAGWNPEGQEITSDVSIPELVATRTNDGAASEFKIASGQVLVTNKMISQIIITKSMFEAWGGGTTTGGYKTMFFWFSVPYEFTAGDIYGFNGQYKLANETSSWEIQSYRGEMRDAGTAGKSPWKRPSKDMVMDKNAGYVLAVRTKAGDFKTADNVSQIRFFIPSMGSVTLEPTATITLAADTTNKDKIQRDWHVINVPVMKSGRGFVNTAEDAFELVYRWSWANGDRWYEPVKIHDNTTKPVNHFNFQAGHAYMVQGHGTLTWNYEDQTGELINAPMRDVALTNKDLRIDLNYDGEQQDKTYVLYRASGTRAYEIGRDLEKIVNDGRSMIYSELDSKLASICLSDTDMVQIPLTVVANEAGEYTLRMPAPVSDIEPVLYDYENETPVTTLLNYDDYTIYLSKGTYTNRFFLGVRTTPFTPTNLNNAGTDANGERAFKYVDRNGNLYILRDGVIYNATGSVVK